MSGRRALVLYVLIAAVVALASIVSISNNHPVSGCPNAMEVGSRGEEDS